MTRIVLVNRYFHPDESATSQFATDLARHLAERHEVVVLTSRQRLEHAQARLAPRDRLDGVRICRLWSTAQGRHRLPGRLLDYLSFLAAVAGWLLVRARRGDVVLAKTDPPLLGVVTACATLTRGVRRIQWLQDLYPETAVQLGIMAPRGMAAGLARRLRNWSVRRSDVVVAVSPGMLEHLRADAGPARLVHIPNWADDFGGAERAPAPGGLTVGYSGNLGRAHPIDALLELARSATDPRLRFMFSGGGAHYERLRAEVTRLGVPNWLFLPYQPRERVGELLRQADLQLVLLDPRVERCLFPSKVYGLLSAGRPILHLGDPRGEVAELIREHACGWSLPADACGPVLELLHELRRAPGRLAEAGRRARQAYEAGHRKSKALAMWDEVLSATAGQTV